MSKTLLIIQREYLTRIRKKSFIIMSILGPLLFAAMFVVPAWIATLEESDEKKIAVIDNSELYYNKLTGTEIIDFEFFAPSEQKSVINSLYSNSKHYAVLIIEDDLLKNPEAAQLYSNKQITIDVQSQISGVLRNHLKNEKLKSFNIDQLDYIVDQINSVNINLSTIRVDSTGDAKETSTEAAMIISLVFAFMSYMFIFIYGSQVMRGVMEEKSSRIVEVIISSVKPFQLMTGKITGIAMVALTQIIIWVSLTFLILGGIKVISPSPEQTINTNTEIVANGTTAEVDDQINIYAEITRAMSGINLTNTLFLFLFYFAAGYILYAAFFAAIGAAVDNETDSQQFMLPVTIPIIIALYVAIAAFRNPHSDFVVIFSMIPLTSPVVMMARAPFDVPLWQIAISMSLLLAGAIFTIWFAGRIYRTGILMYGKKVTYKELWKWFIFSGK
ncbi:ABC transporter permease [Marinilabiliaceae bacterium ANBcel2]|nr:ABC transporter permease [Marinilabiliaceae bacterium ANBcel2]